MRFRSTLAVLVVALAGTTGLEAQAIRPLRGHTAPVSALTFDRDGRRMASASHDHTIKVWDVLTGKALYTCTGHTAQVLALAWSGDGTTLASTGLDGTIRLWDSAGHCRACLHTSERCLQGLAFAPDGLLLACGEDGWVEVWSADGAHRLHTFRPTRSSLYALAVAPDGREMAVAGQDGIIRLLELESGKVCGELDGHEGAVFSLAFAADGRTLLSGGEDGTVRKWRRNKGEPARAAGCLEGHFSPVYQVVSGADGRRLVSAGVDGRVIVWDADTGRAVHSHCFPGKALCVAFTPDGRRIGTGTGQAQCYLMDLPRHVR
jgi:WD40 repeat protein